MEEGVGSGSTDPDQLVAYIDEMESKISTLQEQVVQEGVKMERYKVSSIIRVSSIKIFGLCI